jgi:hypothetical protein
MHSSAAGLGKLKIGAFGSRSCDLTEVLSYFVCSDAVGTYVRGLNESDDRHCIGQRKIIYCPMSEHLARSIEQMQKAFLCRLLPTQRLGEISTAHRLLSGPNDRLG